MNAIDKARNDVRNLLTKIRVSPDNTKMAFQPAPPAAPPAAGAGAPPPPQGAGAPPPQLPPEIAQFLMQQGIDPNTIPPDQLPGVIQQVQQMMAQGGGVGAPPPPPPGAGGPPPPPAGPEAGGPPPPQGGGALPPELVANLDQLSQAVSQLMQAVESQGKELKGFMQEHNQEHSRLNAQMAKAEAQFQTALKFLKQPNEFNS